jgi:glycosyltransferase involved in cell wall biosynthesis
MISEYALENEVKILGYVSNDEMYSLYKEAMALTFVSMIGPTNIPPLEAMWVGCPVIVSNKYAMPEQVGDAGLVIDPLDPQDIAEKILMIRNDRALRTELIRKGHEQSARWGQEEFASRLEEIMLSVLSKDIENNKILTDRSSG